MRWLAQFLKKSGASVTDPRHRPPDVSRSATPLKPPIGGTVLRNAGLDPVVPSPGQPSPISALPAFTEGSRIADSYTIRRKLGAGAMGTVYLAHHEQWDLEVVLKVPNAELLADPENRHRITREAEVWTDLGLHPHIAYCYYAQPIQNILLLVVEYLNAGNLRDWVTEGKCADLRTGLDLAIQLCHALTHAHGKGVVHRDIKPENVLLAQDGSLKLTDFGIARAAGTDAMKAAVGASAGGQTIGSIGTYEYMAPEQFESSHEVDSRVDIFALGVCLYEMFCGKRPYSMAVGARQEAPEPGQLRGDDSIPTTLGALMRRMCAWEKSSRPADVHEITRELCELYRDLFHEASKWADLPRISMEAGGYNNRAISYLHLGKIKEAEDAWRTALSIDAQHPEATYNQGLHLWRSGRMKDDVLVTRMRAVCANRAGEWLPLFLLAEVHLERLDCESAEAALAAIGEPDSGRQEVITTLNAVRVAQPRSGRLLRLQENLRDVMAVSLAGDGHHALLATSNDIGLWDLAAGTCRRSWASGRVWSLCMSRDARYGLSAGSDHVLTLWDLASGSRLRTFQGHANMVWCASFSSDSKHAVSASDDKTIKYWDVATGVCLGTLRGHTDAVGSVCISKSGGHALSGSTDKTMRLWELASGRCLRIFEGHTERVHSVALSADMRYGLSGSTDVKLWEIASGRCIRAFERPVSEAIKVCLSADGRFALSVDPESAEIWEVATGRCLRTFPTRGGHFKTSACLSEDGRRAISVGTGEPLKYWATGIEDNRPVRPWRLSRGDDSWATVREHRTYQDALDRARGALRSGELVTAVEWLRIVRSQPGRKRLAEAAEEWRRLYVRSKRSDLSEGWEGASIEPQLPESSDYVPVFRGCVSSVCFSGDGQQVLFSREEALELWDLASRRCLRTFEGHTATVSSACLSADGRYALSGAGNAGNADNVVKLWDVASGQCLRTFASQGDGVTSVCLSEDGLYAASGSGGQNWSESVVRLWEVNTGRCLRSFDNGHRNPVNSVCITGGSRYILSGGHDGILKLWELAPGQCVRMFSGHKDYVNQVVLTADGLYALSGSYDKTVKLWDLTDGSCLRTFEGHEGSVTSVSVTTDGRHALSGSQDRTLKLWDVGTGRCLRTFEGHTAEVQCAAIRGDGAFAVSGATSSQVKIWTLDWELEISPPRDWDEGARPYLQSFLSAHQPYAGELPADGSPTEREIALSLTRAGKPAWTDNDLSRLLCVLGNAGYGWLRPEGIQRELEKMAANWRPD